MFPEPIMAILTLLFADGPDWPIEKRGNTNAPVAATALPLIKSRRLILLFILSGGGGEFGINKY